jgi:hypothetical protein
MAQSRSLFDVSLRTPQDVQADLRAQIAQAGAMGRVGGGQSGSAAINSAFSQIGAGLGAVLGGQYQDQIRAAQAAEQTIGESQAAIQQAVAEGGDPMLAQRDEFLKAATKLRSINPQASREMMQKYVELDQTVKQQRAAAAQLRAEQARESRKEDADLSESLAGLDIKEEKYRAILANPNAPLSAQRAAGRILEQIPGQREQVMRDSADWDVIEELPVLGPDGELMLQPVAINMQNPTERMPVGEMTPFVPDSAPGAGSVAGKSTIVKDFVRSSQANQKFAQSTRDLFTEITQSPEALTVAGKAAGFGANIKAHAQGLIHSFAGPGATEFNIAAEQDPENQARWQEKMVRAGISSGVSQALVMDIAYALASSMENGGRLSDQDIDRAIQVMGGNTPDPRKLTAVLGALFERRRETWGDALATTTLKGNPGAEGSWATTQKYFDEGTEALTAAYERFGLTKEAAEEYYDSLSGWMGDATSAAQSGQFQLAPQNQQQRRSAAPTAGRVLNVTPVTQ